MTMRILQAVPSEIEVQSARIERTTAVGGVLTKSKAIAITFGGAYRIKFTMRLTWAADKYAHATIYRNGAAIGTPHTLAAAGPVTYVENIGGWSKGDTCELWCRNSTAGYVAYLSGFVLGAEYSNGSGVPIPKGLVLTDTDT